MGYVGMCLFCVGNNCICESVQMCVCVCVTDLCNEHSGGHREARARGEVAGYHDSHSSLREGQLVRVCRQEFVHHQH